jgi:LacI family transcriptional regulator
MRCALIGSPGGDVNFLKRSPMNFESQLARAKAPATLRTIAALAGVSPSTVSRVLNRDPNVRISEASRGRILEIASETGYRPNRLARSLKLQRTFVIGMLIPDITNPLFSALFSAVDEFASAAGYHVILCNTADSATRFQEHLDALSDGHVDGLLIATAHRTDVAVAHLHSRRLPYVLLNRRRDSDEDISVVPNDKQGAQLAVEHLAKLGHRRIAHIAGSLEFSRTAERLEGYREAMRARNLPEIIWQTSSSELDERAGEIGLAELFKGPEHATPTAIFAANDLVALGTLTSARRMKVRTPDDLSIIGCDDIPLASHVQPALTTLRYPFRVVGRLATEQLLRLIAKEPSGSELQVVLPVELVIRASTATPPA